MSNLNEEQFSKADLAARWDARLTHTPREPEGHMPVSEMRKYTDPVFTPWEKFHRQERPYLEGVQASMEHRGVHDPVIIDFDKPNYSPEHGSFMGLLIDGHHRLAAAERGGIKSLPWRSPDR